jgi:cytidylate kinase
MNESLSAHFHKRAASKLVDKACRDWEARQQRTAGQRERPTLAPTFAIALSREAGTQGTLVAQEVGKLLGWNVYDHELLVEIAQDMGLRARVLESVDERRQSWLLETAAALLSAPATSEWGPLVSESAYFHHLVKTVLALGFHGDCVIVGRGAAFILPQATTLRVRLVAPLRERVAVVSRKLGISEREAAKRVRILDRERNSFIQGHFLKTIGDPRNNDLVLNTSRLSIRHTAELVVEALHRLQAQKKEQTAAASITVEQLM